MQRKSLYFLISGASQDNLHKFQDKQDSEQDIQVQRSQLISETYQLENINSPIYLSPTNKNRKFILPPISRDKSSDREINWDKFSKDSIGSNKQERKKRTCQNLQLKPIKIPRKSFLTPQKQELEQGEIIKKFIDQKFRKKQQGEQKLNQQDIIKKNAIVFEQCIVKDDLLGIIFQKIGSCSKSKMFQDIFKLLDSRMHTYNVQDMKMIHYSLNLTNKHFNRIKYHFFNQIITMDYQPHEICQGLAAIEKYRHCIIPKDDLEKQLGSFQGIQAISKSMYLKLYSDFQLNRYFENIDQNVQAQKFSKLIGQMLQTQDCPFYSIATLRERHHKYKLTSQQYLKFKYFLYQSLQEQNKLKDKQIWKILELMDQYKSPIIGQLTIKEIILNKWGLQGFSKRYYESLKVKTNFNHVYFIVHFFLNNENIASTYKDCSKIHQKCVITQDMLQIYMNTFIDLIKELNFPKQQLMDLEDQWEESFPYLQNKQQPYKKLGGWHVVENLCKKIKIALKEDSILEEFYKENQQIPYCHLLGEIKYIMSGRKHFKKSDIQEIHQKLNISHGLFNIYIKAIQKAINQFDPYQYWIIDIINQWRKYIVT